MAAPLQQLHDLYDKSQEVVSFFEELPEKDIRRKHFEILGSQILVSLLNLKINMEYSEKNKEDFGALFHNDQTQIDNYIYNLVQNLDEVIVEAALFQTELLCRFYYSKMTGTTPCMEKYLYKIFATVFGDVENNWQKEECKLLVILWTLRNTIHTGGIYLAKEAGTTLIHKGKEYKFEYAKSPEFLQDGFIINLMFELLESLKTLFSDERIKALGYFEHPSFFALNK